MFQQPTLSHITIFQKSLNAKERAAKAFNAYQTWSSNNWGSLFS